jgi:hypothetical protein
VSEDNGIATHCSKVADSANLSVLNHNVVHQSLVIVGAVTLQVSLLVSQFHISCNVQLSVYFDNEVAPFFSYVTVNVCAAFLV